MLMRDRDYNILTHIIGLRRFMSRLLYEQVVGRGLRRSTYEIAEDGKLTILRVAIGRWILLRAGPGFEAL